MRSVPITPSRLSRPSGPSSTEVPLLRRRTVPPPVIVGFVPLLFGLMGWSSLGGRDAQQSSQPDSIDAAWFEEYPRHDPLPPKELEELTLGVWKQVSTKSPLQLSKELERDHKPRLIFVSARGGDGATRVSLGHGSGIGPALRDSPQAATADLDLGCKGGFGR